MTSIDEQLPAKLRKVEALYFGAGDPQRRRPSCISRCPTREPSGCSSRFVVDMDFVLIVIRGSADR